MIRTNILKSSSFCALLFTAFAATSLAGCAVDSANDSAETLGKVQMPLTVVNGDTTYRLDNASFTFVGATNTTVSSGLETTLEVELPVGAYAVELADGWELVSIVDGVETVLSAVLVSENPMNFSVTGGAVSDLVFDFRVGDNVIEFGEGTARLSINVVETPNGYFDNGTWSGFAFTAADTSSTISPADFSATPSGSPFCVSGTVPPDPSYGSFALLGVNLNQAKDGTTSGPAFAAGTGINVDIENPLGSQLMLQLVGADPSDRWCTYTTTGGIVSWSDFRRECWSPLGAVYAMEPLAQVNLVVPTNGSTALPLDFCLNDLQVVE